MKVKVISFVSPMQSAKIGKTNVKKAITNTADALLKKTRRNVLAYKGSLYYNPAKAQVRKLIVNGVKEIVQNYDVDGIHMDDYFYPTFSSSNVNSAFDAKEYRASTMAKSKKSIVTFRRQQVNILVKDIHSAVKAINPNVTFGISPAGNIYNLTSRYSYILFQYFFQSFYRFGTCPALQILIVKECEAIAAFLSCILYLFFQYICIGFPLSAFSGTCTSIMTRRFTGDSNIHMRSSIK